MPATAEADSGVVVMALGGAGINVATAAGGFHNQTLVVLAVS